MLTERAQFDCRCFLEVKVMAAKLQTEEAVVCEIWNAGLHHSVAHCNCKYTHTHTWRAHTHSCQHTEAKGSMEGNVNV